MSKNVRMADIAHSLNISVVSVSKALSGKDGVSPEMRRKIISTAKEMGYEFAPARQDAFQDITVGILVADRYFDDSSFYAYLYRSVLKQCTALHYICILEIVPDRSEHGCILPTMLLNHTVNALLFMGQFSHQYIDRILQSGLPFMFLDFYDTVSAGNCVLSDNLSGGYQITEYLLSIGKKRIEFVGSIFSTSSITDRYLGYCRALLAAGIEPKADWRVEDRDENGSALPLCLPKEMPDAFVCNCDKVAYKLVHELRSAGYRVPQDIIVCGYDDFGYSKLCQPPLTSYRVDVDGMATAALEQLRRKINGAVASVPAIVVPGQFIQRGTVPAASSCG